MKNLSFSSRLLLMSCMPALLVAVLITLFFIMSSIRDSELAELRRAQTLADGLARATEFGIATENRIVLEDATQAIIAVPSICAVRYLNATNLTVLNLEDSNHKTGDISRLAHNIRRLFSDFPLDYIVTANIHKSTLAHLDDPLFDNSSAGEPIDASQPIGRVELRVDLSLAYENQYRAMQRVFTFVGIVLLLALAAAFQLAQSVIGPVRNITASVKRLARNDYVKVPSSELTGDLKELANGINYLSGELRCFHASQDEAIALATSDLQKTLSLLEMKNSELETAREQAEKASEFKSQFVANMSHEIRTPLNTIIGILSVMDKKGLDITQVDQINMIKNSSDTLLYLIEDILDISKIESGNLLVECVNTDIEMLLAEINSSATIQAIDRGIELYISPIPDATLRNTYTDPLRLRQVLTNLLSNAIKFTHSGHVSLTTEIVHVESGQRVVQFTVEDTGIGIPKEKQEQLFSAFTQVDMSTTRSYGGSGLGLYICSGIVQLLGGVIELSSTEGVGTRVDVVIPLSVTNNSVEHPVLPAITSGKTMRYSDSYQPLEQVNKQLLKPVIDQILNEQANALTSSVHVSNIPNSLLSKDWLRAVNSVDPLFRDGSETSKVNLAWISRVSAEMEKTLMQAGYTGYILKTPSLPQLKRNIESALSGSCYACNNTQSSVDDRPDKSHQSLTVLAVDDQKINIDLLMQYFDYLDIRGIYASSGKEALNHIQSEPVDLVLLDLHMPELDGFQVVKNIRSCDSINARKPIIAMTADAYQTTVEKALASGFDGILTKPATVQQVSETILKWVSPSERCVTKQRKSMVDIQACAIAVHSDKQWARNAMITYAHEVPGHIGEIRNAVSQRDSTALYHVAHSIKGVSRLLQIHEVADTAEALERACNSANWAEIRNQSRELKRLLLVAEDECRSIAN